MITVQGGSSPSKHCSSVPSAGLLRRRSHIFPAGICSQSWEREKVPGSSWTSTASRGSVRPPAAAPGPPAGRCPPPSQAGSSPLKQCRDFHAFTVFSLRPYQPTRFLQASAMLLSPGEQTGQSVVATHRSAGSLELLHLELSSWCSSQPAPKERETS